MKRFTLFTLLFALIGFNAFAQSKQFLYIEFTPSDATIEINGVVKESVDGIYQELLPLGQHTYKLYREGYSTLTGTVTIYNQHQTKKMTLKLKKQEGYLSVSNNYGQDITGAEVYVEDTFIGNVPLTAHPVASGTHNITIKHPLYKEYKDKCTITDEKITAIAPTLVPNYTLVSVSTDPSAEIYINDKYIAKGSWTGKLTLGQPFVFESRVPSHRSGRVEEVLLKSDRIKSISIPAPVPIYGSLVITSAPTKGTVYLDGAKMGDTPMYIPSVLIGEHIVTVRYNEYELLTEKVTVTDSEEVAVNFKKEYGSLNIITIPDEAAIYIDGKEYGTAPKFIQELIIGDHKVEVKYGDTVMTENITLTKDEKKELVFTFPIEKMIVVEEEAVPLQFVDVKPTFKGGDTKKFTKWVNQRLVYPLVAKENGIQGKVTLQFIVEKDGTLSNIKVVRGVDPALDKEAIRLVTMSPKWTPGKVDRKPVRTLLTFTVLFQIR